MKRCCKLCEIGYIVLPAFGVGVLSALVLPYCALIGLSAALSIAIGTVCLINSL